MKNQTNFKKRQDDILNEVINKLSSKNNIKEGYGPNGYFPPMGAPRDRETANVEEPIYKGDTALKVANMLKKTIDKIQPEFLELGQMVVPFVNYYPSTRYGNLVLGYGFVDSGKPATKSDGDYGNSARKKYDNVLKSILTKGKTELWDGYHVGFNGTYKGNRYKSGMVRSIVTPGRTFSNEFASRLRNIFEK